MEKKNYKNLYFFKKFKIINFFFFFSYLIIELQKKEGNNICIDCGAPNPQWYLFYLN